ncbi:MAG: sel1 repeat family protein [Gammaproteobacteria bacterium]|jgi:TPR repeat protein|nr:sel1 repeat family protein [Gammaproteobacteria bacterium]
MSRNLVSILAMILLAFSSAVTAADYQDGRDAYDVGDFDKAMAVWAPAAESGDADSQYGMGLLYSEGIVVPMDDLQALNWFGLAADQGHGEAQYKLGVMHANGWGVPMNEDEAMKWYELAAENGITAAQVSLGTMYQNGFSVEQDKVAALMWFSIAMKLGDEDAQYHQEYLAERMPAEELAEADAEVNAWFNEHQTMLAETR